MGIYQDAHIEHGSHRKAALALGLSKSTFQERLKKENSTPHKKLILTPDKPASDKLTRVLYFTDAHNQPGLSLDRFHWLYRFAVDQKPDIIVDGGDGDDFHSLCSHERDETYKGRLKPLLAADLEQAAKARAILRPLDCRKIITLGNHEHRLWTYEDANPAMHGIITNIFTDVLESTGWEWHPYGSYVNVAGVNFTHVPFNTMGKPVGGESACKQIADRSLLDICYGHTHHLDLWNAPKFGNQKSVTAFNGGCFMPDGYIPNYVKNTRKEFWYGCHILTIGCGKILSIKSWSMLELGQMYGGGDDKRNQV